MLNIQDVERDIDNLNAIQSVLDRIVEEAGTHGVYLVDDSGFLVAEAGDIDLDRVALAALIGASFGATSQIAHMLGEEDFNRLTHQGDDRHLFIGKCGVRHILITVFGSETNLGLVKLYAEQAADFIAELLSAAESSKE